MITVLGHAFYDTVLGRGPGFPTVVSESPDILGWRFNRWALGSGGAGKDP